MTEQDNTSTPTRVGSHDGLGVLVNRALFADDCQRLAEWSLIGPVQRAALESFAERLLAAERRPESVVRLALMHAAFDVPSGMTVGELREIAAKMFGAQAVEAALAALRLPNK